MVIYFFIAPDDKQEHDTFLSVAARFCSRTQKTNVLKHKTISSPELTFPLTDQRSGTFSFLVPLDKGNEDAGNEIGITNSPLQKLWKDWYE